MTLIIWVSDGVLSAYDADLLYRCRQHPSAAVVDHSKTREKSVSVQKSFIAEASSAFGFLVSDFRFAGPEFREFVLPSLSYVGRGATYRVMLDADDKAVLTRAEAEVGSKHLVAELEDLVEAAKLGARNHVVMTVTTLRGLRHALESQANFVRLLQPHMAPDNLVSLMRLANAREWDMR